MNSVVSVETELAETTEYKRFEILKSQSCILLLHPEKQLAMSKNVIHNFNLSIKNSTDIKSSEDLTKAIIKELAKVSKEMSQQKDIVQEWQEQKNQNATAILNNSSASTEGGANDTNVETIKKTTMSISNTPLVSGETTSIPSTLFGGGVADTAGRTTMSSATSDNTTPPTAGAENSSLNFSNGITTQAYANVAAQQTLTVPESFQTNGNEPSVEVIKAEVKKKLDAAISANETSAIEYWRNISKAFNEGATAQYFDGKPNDMLFTQLYAMLKQSNQAIENQIFNWDIVREKMIESIDNNILKGKISIDSKVRWKLIQKQLKDDTVNVANLFERYNELFLLLKEVEGLHSLPNTLTITTKTKIYPNLSADRVYAEIGKENVYVFLKEINNKEITGSAVNKGAVKIKNTGATKFIVGESLDFILDEVLVNDIKFEKKDINWIVYNSQKKNDKGIIFINEGISFSYNFDAPGKYKVEAYGGNPGSNSKNKKNVKLAAFVEVEIIAQEITIVPPATIKTTFIRPSTEEQLFKVGLKNPEVKTLNPLKLYYQIAYTNADKVTTISDEQEMDSTGIVKLAMPNLGEYSIKVVSKNQYTLNQKYSINTIKNFINNIEIIKNKAEKDIYLWSKSNQDVHFKAQSFKMEPATPQEKQNIKWLVYDKNGQIYIPDGLALQLENNEAGKQYLIKGESFAFRIPKKEGEFTIESYSNVKEGFKSKSSKKIFVKHPQVTEAYWTYNDGNKKKTSGFAGEINHIKASIPGYVNQPVRIKFYLNDSKDVNYYNDTKTNDNGEIDKVLKFDANLQKHFGIKNGKTAKIRFELEGIQNGNVPYLFKENTNAYKETLLNVTTSAKITDAYFMYDGNRVNPFTQVPYGAKVTGIVKTLNMVGSAVVLKVRRKDAQHSQLKMKTIVKNEGEASITFVLDKKWRPITPLFGVIDSYYLGMEGIESKLYLENGLNAVVGTTIKPIKNMEIIFPLIEKPINDTNSKWGKNYNWTDDDGRNQATFDSYRDHGNRKHAARDLYTEPKTLVVAIADGKVLEARNFYAGTHQVTVLHKLKDGRKFIARYGELDSDSITVKKGDIIKQKKVIGRTGKLQGKSVIGGQDIYMLHFEIFSAEKGENLNNPLTDKFNGSPFQRRKDLIDSIDILLEGYKNTFETNKEYRKEIKTLSISDKGKQFIKDWELFKKKMYDNDGDNNSDGNCTIGYGHKIHDGKCDGSSSEDKFKNGISENEASKLFDNDILIFEKVIRSKIKMPLYQYEFDALVSYVYNIGPAFKAPNLIRYINSKDYTSAVYEIETGSQNTKRRKQERDMFSKGIYDSAH